MVVFGAGVGVFGACVVVLGACVVVLGAPVAGFAGHGRREQASVLGGVAFGDGAAFGDEPRGPEIPAKEAKCSCVMPLAVISGDRRAPKTKALSCTYVVMNRAVSAGVTFFTLST